jgi:hypothetical protein
MSPKSRNVLKPAGWESLERMQGGFYSGPTDNKWRVVKGDYIALAIYPVWPVGDTSDTAPSVGLYVPPKWKLRNEFTKLVKARAPKGFEHISQYPEGEIDDTCPVFKYVHYSDFIGTGGVFNEQAFLKAFQDAAAALLAMEKSIDGIVERIGAPN